MSAIDTLFFPPTGKENSYYLLVTISKGGGGLRGRVTVEAPKPLPEGSDAPPAYPEREDDLALVMKEAGEFAAVNGYPLRVSKPVDIEFPSTLGTYAERRIEE